jgi:hypothetical protein
MKYSFLITILFFNFLSQSQDIELINEDGINRYKIAIDKINYSSENYPDGWWEICDSIDHNRTLYYVTISNGIINGPFINLTGARRYFGNYYKDSLWTFLTAPDDTTFKMGLWKMSVSEITLPDKFYEIKYENDSIQRVTWNFQNGKPMREAYYKKEFGLVELKYYDKSSYKLTYKREIKENYTITTDYMGDSILSMSITQGGISIYVKFPDNNIFYNSKGFTLTVDDVSNESEDVRLDLDEKLRTKSYINVDENLIIKKSKNESLDLIYGKRRKSLRLKRRKLEN